MDLKSLKIDNYLDKYFEFTGKFPFLSKSIIYNLILNLKNLFVKFDDFYYEYYIHFTDIEELAELEEINLSKFEKFEKFKKLEKNIEIYNSLNSIIKTIVKIIKLEKNYYYKFILLYIIQNSYIEWSRYEDVEHDFIILLSLNTRFNSLYYNYNYIFLKDIINFHIAQKYNYDIIIEYIQQFIKIIDSKYIHFNGFLSEVNKSYKIYNNKQKCISIKNTIKYLKLYIDLVLYIDNPIYTDNLLSFVNSVLYGYTCSFNLKLNYFIKNNSDSNMTPYIYEKNVMLYKYYINQFDEMLKIIKFHNTLRYTFLKMIYIGNYK